MNKNKQDTGLTIIMVVIFIIVTAVWFLSFFLIRQLFGAPSGAGTVGDVFGAVGALFSGWAFVGVLWAILLQRKSLQIQHDDLKATLDEMKQAREAQEESAESLRTQVEAIRLQTRAHVLTTLVETPLKVGMSSFLSGFTDHVLPLRDHFKENLSELAVIGDKLKDAGENARKE